MSTGKYGRVSQKAPGNSKAPKRRAAQRTAFDIHVGVATKHRLFVGLVDNISSGGLFIATDEALQTGDKIEVRFRIPDVDHEFHKQGKVVWVRPYDELGNDRNTQAGAGIKILDLSEDEQRMLNTFIANHDPLFFVD